MVERTAIRPLSLGFGQGHPTTVFCKFLFGEAKIAYNFLLHEKGCNDDAGANSSLKELEKEVQFYQTGAPNDGFLLNALKHFFAYSEYFQISRNAF